MFDSVNLSASVETSDDLICNQTCCLLSGTGRVLCFQDYNFTDYYNLTQTPVWELAIRWTYTSAVFLAGFIGNFVIIHILLSNRLLLRPSVNKFILNMSIADFILTCTGPILFTISDTNEFWVLGKAWCHLEGFIQITLMIVSVSSLTVISFDRMIGVVFPFYKHLNFWQTCVAIGCIWVVSATLAIPFSMYRIYTEHPWADVLETLCQETGDMMAWWSITMVAIVWIPLTIMVFCYLIIFFKFKKYHREGFGREHPLLTSRKKKVFRMMFAVVLVFVMCWFPLQLFMVSKKYFLDSDLHVYEDKEKAYDTFMTISNYMVYLNPVLDPIVYALMHENFKRAFRITYAGIFKTKPMFVLTRGTGTTNFIWSTRNDRHKKPKRRPMDGISEEKLSRSVEGEVKKFKEKKSQKTTNMVLSTSELSTSTKSVFNSLNLSIFNSKTDSDCNNNSTDGRK